MPVLVDTNVVSDVVSQDPKWAGWASAQLLQHAGDICINPLVYAELCCRAASFAEVDRLVARFGFQYQELSKQALYLAAQAYVAYKQRGGVKTSPLPDFFIGAHAEAAGFTLLTRDATRYRTYFPTVSLICP